MQFHEKNDLFDFTSFCLDFFKFSGPLYANFSPQWKCKQTEKHTCPWPKDNIFRSTGLCSGSSGIKLWKDAKGSHPGDRIRINGVVLLDSAKLVAMSKRGILMNSSPMCLVTYSLIEKITLSGRSIRYKTILSNSLEKRNEKWVVR